MQPENKGTPAAPTADAPTETASQQFTPETTSTPKSSGSRRVDEYPGRWERVSSAITRAHSEGADFVEQLVKHFFPEPTDWDIPDSDFENKLRTITPHEIEDVIEDLGLRVDRELVFQCQHCGRYSNLDEAILAWVVDYDRSTDDPNQLVVVPSAACGSSCQRRIRENSFRLVT